MDLNKSPNPDSLSKFYDTLKDRLVKPNMDGLIYPGNPHEHDHGGMMDVSHPMGMDQWRHKALKCREKLKEDCCKHLIVDIYCHILPLDKEYIAGHRGQCVNDINQMLAAKNMTGLQYLQSCSDSTKAPLMEYILRSIDTIGKQYMEDAEEEVKVAQANGENVPEPEAPSPDTNDDVESQLVDVKKDTEYNDFMDKLKQKTINKIVSDVSKIINDKQQENDMTFKTPTEKPDESAVAEAVDFLQKKLWTESDDMSPAAQEAMIGMAIREATMFIMDQCFRQPMSSFSEYASRMHFGKGYIINESALDDLRAMK